MQTSTKIKLAKTGGLLLIRYPLARTVTGKVAKVVVRRKLRGIQASASDTLAVVPPPASRRNRVIVIAAAAGGGAVLLGAARKRSAAKDQGASAPSVPPSSPVVAPTPAAPAAAPVAAAPPKDTPASSDSAEGAPPVPADAAATELGDGDEALVARVQSTLFGSETPLAISVKAHAGVVTLEGAVSDLDAATQLVKDAEQVEGVRAVQSELEIQGAS